MTLTQGIWVTFSAYFILFLVTLGHFVRGGRSGLRRRLVQVGLAMAWPFYWIIFHGVTGTISQVRASLAAHGDLLYKAWALGMVLFPAYYIGMRYQECGYYLCLDVIGKSLLWAPFWPVYLIVNWCAAPPA